MNSLCPGVSSTILSTTLNSLKIPPVFQAQALPYADDRVTRITTNGNSSGIQSNFYVSDQMWKVVCTKGLTTYRNTNMRVLFNESLSATYHEDDYYEMYSDLLSLEDFFELTDEAKLLSDGSSLLNSLITQNFLPIYPLHFSPLEALSIHRLAEGVFNSGRTSLDQKACPVKAIRLLVWYSVMFWQELQEKWERFYVC